MDIGMEIMHSFEELRLSLPHFVETFFLDLSSVAFCIVITILCLGIPLTLIGTNGGLLVGGFFSILSTTVICPYLFKRYDNRASAAPVEASRAES